jgi:hypothetical protein
MIFYLPALVLCKNPLRLGFETMAPDALRAVGVFK